MREEKVVGVRRYKQVMSRTAVSTAAMAAVGGILLPSTAVFAGTAKSFTTGSNLLTSASYSPSGLPNSGSDVLLTTTGTALTINANTALVMASLNATNTTAYAISNADSNNNSSFTIGATANTNVTAGAAAADLIYLGGATSSLTITGTGSGSKGLALVLGAGGNFDVANSGATLTISSVISGAFGIDKTGAGLATLSGANTYSGGVSVSAGTLKLGNALALGSTTNALEVDGGTLDLNSNSVTTSALSGAGGVILNGGNGTVTLSTGSGSTSSTSFAGVIQNNSGGAGLVAMTKLGSGTLTLTGANTYTGATSIQSGGILVDLSTGSLGATTALTLGGSTVAAPFSTPTLTIQGNSSGTSSQTVGALTIGTTDSAIVIDPNTGSGTNLTLSGAWTRATGAGILDLTLPALTTLTASTAPTLQSSILPYVIVNGTDFATIASGNVSAFAAYTPYVTSTAPTSATGNTLSITSSSTGNVALGAGTTSLNSIQVNDAADRTIDIGTGKILNLGVKGAILDANGSGALTIGLFATPGTINAGGTTANATGELILINESSNAMTVNSVIGNHGSGAVTLSKSGQGLLVLANGANLFTGGTNVNGGTLSQGVANALGPVSNALTINAGATVDLNGFALSTGGLSGQGTILNNSTGSNLLLTVGNGNNSGSFAGIIADNSSGTGTVGLIKVGTGTETLSGANTFSAGTTLTNGTLTVNNAAALGSGTLTITGGGIANGSTSITLNNPTQYWNGNFRLSSTFLTTLNMGTGTVTLGNDIQLMGGNGTYGSVAIVSGVIQNDSPSTPRAITILSGGSNSGAIGFAGANTYTGGTTIGGGSFKILNSQAFGLGSLTIANGSTIQQSTGTAVIGLTGISITGDLSFSATSGPINLGTSAVTLTGFRRITTDNGSATFGGNIGGSGGIHAIGTAYSSTLALAGSASTFDGGVLVNGAGTGNMTVSLGAGTSAGTGQVRLTSSGTSRVSLAGNATIDSLATAIHGPVTTGGTNYTVAPTVTVSAPTFGGTTAVITTSLSAGAVVFTISDYGSGYTAAPTYTLVGGTTTGTAATIVAPAFGSSSIALGTNTLSIGMGNDTTSTYSGIISGAGNLVKRVDGLQRLTAVNTYIGATSITGGVLQMAGAGTINTTSGININGTGATFQYDSTAALTKTVTFGASGGTFQYDENTTGYTSATTLTVGANATLAGSGKINGNVAVTSGTLAPGNPQGTLTVGGNLDLSAAGSTDAGELVFAVGTGGNEVVVGGTLTIGTLDWADFTFSDNGSLNTASYVLFDGTSPIVGAIGTANGTINAYATGTLSIDNVNNDVVLSVTVTPEPASLAIVGLAGAGLLGRRRRRTTPSRS